MTSTLNEIGRWILISVFIFLMIANIAMIPVALTTAGSFYHLLMVAIMAFDIFLYIMKD